jgi:hypothetical protein
LDDDQDTEETRNYRAPAPAPGRLGEQERRKHRREDRHREADRGRLGQRNSDRCLVSG